jgi:hypothetical protein
MALSPCWDVMKLERLRQLNPDFHFVFNNVALVEDTGSPAYYIRSERRSRNASLVPGKKSAVTRDVPVLRLDEYIARNILRSASDSSRLTFKALNSLILKGFGAY